jgi:hypothetical protein
LIIESLAKCIDNTVVQIAPCIGSFSKKPPKAFEINNINRIASEKTSKLIIVDFILKFFNFFIPIYLNFKKLCIN